MLLFVFLIVLCYVFLVPSPLVPRSCLRRSSPSSVVLMQLMAGSSASGSTLAAPCGCCARSLPVERQYWSISGVFMMSMCLLSWSIWRQRVVPPQEGTPILRTSYRWDSKILKRLLGRSFSEVVYILFLPIGGTRCAVRVHPS